MKKILFVGDIVGKPGRNFLAERLSSLRRSRQIDLVVVNAENSAAGSGVNARIVSELESFGVNGITLGDHVWDQKSFPKEIETLDNVCRPANLPDGVPGRDHIIIEKENFRLGIFTVLGRTFMAPCDCPFRTCDRLLAELGGQVDAVLVEVHAEATSEKIALGWYLDGKVAAVVGTHTHVPTADACILPRGTAYITDVGMTGPHRSVIGREIEPVVARFIDGMPRRFEVATEDRRISSVLLTLDPASGRALDIEFVQVKEGK